MTSGVLYLVDSVDPTKVYYSDDKGATWTQLDVDPSDSSGDNKSRDHKIKRAWHDRTNEIIYFVDAIDYAGASDFDVWSLDYSGSESAPTTTEISTETGADANSVTVYDIFMIGTDVFVLNSESRNAGSDKYLVVWDVDTHPFVEKDKYVILNAANDLCGIGIVSGTDYYTSLDQLTGGDIHVLKYDNTGPTISVSTGKISLYSMPGYAAQANRLGCSYDGSNVIYFISQKDADSKYYLVSYNISGDSMTALGEHNVSLMCDRNTLSSSVYEKAFHVTEYKIYQLHSVLPYQLHLIDTPNTDAVIIGLTDNFFINNDGDMWEYIGSINDVATVFIHHQIQEASFAIIEVFNNAISLSKNMTMTFRYEYTTAGSTSEEIIFEGVIERFSEGKMQKVSIRSPAKREIKRTQPSGDYTKDSDGLISQLLTDYNDYATAGTLTDGADLGTLTLGGQQTEETIFDDCAEFEAWIWYFNPVGKLYFNNGTIDSTIDYTEASALSGVKQDHVHEEYNKIKVLGAYVSGVQAVSDWKEDADSQQRVGVNKKVISITILNTNALCNTAATNLLTVLAKDPKKVVFSVRDTTAGYIQVGETITFEYSVGGLTIASDQYLITSAVIDKYGVITYTIVDELT